MTSILCSIPHVQDGTSLYRAIGPLQTLRRKLGNMEFLLNADITWMLLKGADFVFFQRPALNDRLEAVRFCKVNRKAIWVDYDDNLHAVPICNKRHPTYGHPQIQHNIATIMAMADLVSVSTEHLANVVRNIIRGFPDSNDYVRNPDKVIVVPNAYDPEVHATIKDTREPRARTIAWRGSDSHSKDLMLHTEALKNVVREHGDWLFEFMGEPFWGTIEELKKVARPQSLAVTAAQDPLQFFRYLSKQRPALMIVPLEDQSFNRSKSNIAYIEAVTAGAVTLAPDWDEWRKPGVITYSGTEDFERKLKEFMRSDHYHDELWKAGADYVREHLHIAKVNRMREGIIDRMMELSRREM